MMQYSGFGGLKFVLNPVASDIDINNWKKTEHDLFPITQQLHQLLKENAEDKKQYQRYVDSMKSSVLTAFYTPPEIINAVSSISFSSLLFRSNIADNNTSSLVILKLICF